MRDAEQSVVKLIDAHGRPKHYDDIAYELGAEPGLINALCNRLVVKNVLTKPKAGWFGLPEPEPLVESDDPWDMSPGTPGQIRYVEEQVHSFAIHTMSEHDTTILSTTIDKFNVVRRLLGIPFREYE